MIFDDDTDEHEQFREKSQEGSLGFYHVFSPILKELIMYYSKACEAEQDMTLYRQLAQDFHINCSSSGYEAFYALDQKLSENDPKKAVLKDLISEWNEESVSF